MHRAIIYSCTIMGLFTFGLTIVGPITRVLYPKVEADMAVPILILDLMPGWLAGLVLAAPLAAIMSTVDSMLLLTSSAIVKDIYLNYINPKASDRTIMKLSYMTTLLIGVLVVLLSLTPPDYVQMIVLYAVGGLEATFFAPIVFGLYWKRANHWGATASMLVGLISYILIENAAPNPFGMLTIVTTLVLSIVTMVVVSLMTRKPSQDILEKFWGKTMVKEQEKVINK
ncbi:sodium:solute symporter family protein [Melghirimyces profundicolus]|uniref:Sodium:solute symporter family protein n=2 Tax=Melghirimyces profundicolus TaxID=1242148 RepID=A0A2T6BCZ0_9BACL|nr:sodium:solute symporter family protein [Melghirimyces profundicolus]